MLTACTFGLCLLDKETGKVDILQDGYLLKDILYMDGSVWLCTCGDGLIRFDLNGKTMEQFTTESGLPSNYVNSIMWADDYLWLGLLLTKNYVELYGGTIDYVSRENIGSSFRITIPFGEVAESHITAVPNARQQPGKRRCAY
jgi:hypothetical protein